MYSSLNAFYIPDFVDGSYFRNHALFLKRLRIIKEAHEGVIYFQFIQPKFPPVHQQGRLARHRRSGH